VPQIPAGILSGVADPEAARRAREELDCWRLEATVEAALNRLQTNQPASPSAGTSFSPMTGMDIYSVMMSVESDPTILSRCPRLRYLLEKWRAAREMADRAAALREWEQRYGVPQVPRPPGGGTP
jgi:hypothetical protein